MSKKKAKEYEDCRTREEFGYALRNDKAIDVLADCNTNITIANRAGTKRASLNLKHAGGQSLPKEQRNAALSLIAWVLIAVVVLVVVGAVLNPTLVGQAIAAASGA
jgi:hypothetical protein